MSDRDLLAEIVAAADALTALSFAIPANERQRVAERVAALRLSHAIEAARAALGAEEGAA